MEMPVWVGDYNPRSVADQLCKWDWAGAGLRGGLKGGAVDIFNNKVSPLTTSLQACHGIYYKHCVYVMFAKGFALFSAGGAPPPPSADNWKNSWGVYVM